MYYVYERIYAYIIFMFMFVRYLIEEINFILAHVSNILQVAYLSLYAYFQYQSYYCIKSTFKYYI